MKFCIFVCIFVVLACHEAFCGSPIDFPAEVDGNCKISDIAQKYLNECQAIVCKKGENGGIEISRTPCDTARCPNGKVLGNGPHDLTKKHPACCLPKTCDD